MFKSDKEALSALHATLKELEVLTKSWDAKAEDEMEKSDEEDTDLEKSEGDLPPENQDAPPEAAPAPAADPSQDPAATPDEGGDDTLAQITQEASQLSDEELDMMLHALMSEKDNRSAQQPGVPPAGAPPAGAPPAPAGAPPAEENPLAMSMKAEFSKLSKSFTTQIESLNKSVATLQAANKTLSAPRKLPTSKPASTNVEVLEKSVKAPEKMNKSEVSSYLLGEMRTGNKKITSDLVATFGAAKTPDALNEAYAYAAHQGVIIPSKK